MLNYYYYKVCKKAEQQRHETALTDNADMDILICLYTGLRIGELCVLKWTDINFELSTLTVNGTQARTDNGVEIISPKSKTSKKDGVDYKTLSKILGHSS